CVPAQGWLAAVAAAFERPPAPDMVTGRVLPLGPAQSGLHAVSLRTSADRIDFFGAAMPWKVGTGANVAMTRHWAIRVGGYDERLGVGSPGKAAEDLDLSLRLLRAGARIR